MIGAEALMRQGVHLQTYRELDLYKQRQMVSLHVTQVPDRTLS
jgi:hypothetical protein